MRGTKTAEKVLDSATHVKKLGAAKFATNPPKTATKRTVQK